MSRHARRQPLWTDTMLGAIAIVALAVIIVAAGIATTAIYLGGE